jgi:hypothetical protein
LQPIKKCEFEAQNKKRGGEWDHPDRKDKGKIQDSTINIRTIIAIHTVATEEQINASKMTEPCHTFFKEVYTAIANYLINHFQNNLSAFIQKYTKSGNSLIQSLKNMFWN